MLLGLQLQVARESIHSRLVLDSAGIRAKSAKLRTTVQTFKAHLMNQDAGGAGKKWEPDKCAPILCRISASTVLVSLDV